MMKRAFLFILPLLMATISFAASAPTLPYVHHGVCEGEDCNKQRQINDCRAKNCKLEGCSADYCGTTPPHYVFPMGKVSSNMALHVRDKALASRIIVVIPANVTFEVLDYDLYTLKTQPYRLNKADAETCDPPLKPGTTIYILYALGEGNHLTWQNGKTGSCWFQNSAHLYQAQRWYHVRYQGREGWWGDPLYCTRSGRDEKCPSFKEEK